jgi:HK97 family phage prohead protease
MTDSVTRSFEFRAEPSPDGLTLEGYAAVFNTWTEIEDWNGSYREQIAPGAFKRSIGQRTPILQFDHGAHPLIGSIPLGRFTSVTEDDHGLKVRARLSDNWLVEPVRDAIRDGSVSGMSFRFRPIREEWSKDRSERTHREVELFEAGPVVWPAYETTSVGVRSRQALLALDDPDVRREIAALLASGTDLRSLAQAAPDDESTPPVDAPAERHAETSLSAADIRAFLNIYASR